jgi:cytochrome c oxidase assembly protein subunit 15
MDTPLYHFGPTAQLLLVGGLIAALPLAWLAWRSRHDPPGRRASRLIWLMLFLTFDLVLFGAFTRLTDSGLGCPDWPGCYGQATPLGARDQIQAAQDLMPTGPVTHGKAWIEMIHRYLATGVGGLILVWCIMAWRRRGQGDPQAGAGWATFTLFWVCLQGAFGALTVTMKLFPAIVTLHLLGGLILLALLAHQAARTAPSRGLASGVPAPGLRRWLLMAGLILLGQIALGGWVSTNYAVLACDTFPMCQGSYWPKMDFAAGFEWWRPLGHTAAGELLSFEALTAIHYVHRLAAYGVMAVLWWVSWRMHQAGLNGYARVLAALVLLQFLTGLSNVVLGWPLLAAVMHTGGAAAMLVVLVLARSRTVSPLHSTIPS